MEGDGNLGCPWLPDSASGMRGTGPLTLREPSSLSILLSPHALRLPPGDIDGIKPSLLCLNVKAALLHMAFSLM